MTDPLADLPVWLINLDRSPDRLSRMDAGLRAQGLAYERLPAIDGKAEFDRLLPRVDRAAYERNMGQTLLPGKVGCYFSHLAAWERLVDSGKPMALILEDDVVFHEDFREALALALKAEAHWDLLRLNATRARFPVSRGKAGPYAINAYYGRFTGNGAYLLKADTAARVAPRIQRMRWSFEHEIGRFFEHDYRLAGLEPFPSHVEDFGQSQIVGLNNAKLTKPSFIHRLPHFARKIESYYHRGLHLYFSGKWPLPKD
ncbi:glycosyltransferase family 25 protein [Alkalilacustris brevis]|uniref:glycosyltransferase family 25 protein n=1 Tax=Alkalilacustris brevis TaxID=2026338 RepID=UPI000E0D6928|nr:glycosyltransferase family 25 protein [Alkalilacustris brevis]